MKHLLVFHSNLIVLLGCARSTVGGENRIMTGWRIEYWREYSGAHSNIPFFVLNNFNSGKLKQIKILLDYLKTNLQIHQSSVSLPLLFVSPAACFGSGMQLMDSSEWQPLKWHFFRSVDKPCVATRPHESHLSLNISAALAQADQTSRVEPSLTTAHDRYVTTWKWSRMHSNHTEPELTLSAHHHLEAWRERQSRGWSPRDDMLSWPGHHFEMKWDSAVWASHRGSGRQGGMWQSHRNYLNSFLSISMLICTRIW